jgi:ribosomal protein L7/L12
MNPEDKLRRIFSDAVSLGHVGHAHAEVMHERVLELQIDMMLELAAAQHEVKQLQEQREATRAYLGVRLSRDDVAPDDEEPIETIRHILTKILADYPEQKIRQIKEVRGNQALADAWAKVGGAVAISPDMYGNPRAGFGLKEAKDIMDSVWQNNSVYVGRVLVKL